MNTSNATRAGEAFAESLTKKQRAELQVKMQHWQETLRQMATVHAAGAKEWEATYGEPFPATIEDWERLVARFDLPGRFLPAEKIASQRWTGADVLSFVEGGLLHAKDIADGAAEPEAVPLKMVGLTELVQTFGMTPKAIKWFCSRHNVPTRQEARRFFVAIVPFYTAYAQDTNVRTDAALRKRATRLISQQTILAKLDDSCRQFFGA